MHALALRTFYHDAGESCLELHGDSVGFSAQAPSLAESISARALDERHGFWVAALPREAAHLWEVLVRWEPEVRQALFAHVVALSINAVHESWQRRPRALAHGARLAEFVELDMAAVGWTPTVDNYLGRVTKARILQAVGEACGSDAVELIASMKKNELAEAAERLLDGSGWLPEPLRTNAYAVAVTEESEAVASDNPGHAEDDAVVVGQAAE